MNVGFIGLGIMGTPMAGHLIDAGHKLFVYDVFKIPAEVTDKGATAVASSAEVA
ncbi:MAG: 2-hydroxy-3-oxopropionate reductase, partial [Rhizobiales bacterium 39-66-18]